VSHPCNFGSPTLRPSPDHLRDGTPTSCSSRTRQAHETINPLCPLLGIPGLFADAVHAALTAYCSAKWCIVDRERCRASNYSMQYGPQTPICARHSQRDTRLAGELSSVRTGRDEPRAGGAQSMRARILEGITASP
jgi:hypothetical protein